MRRSASRLSQHGRKLLIAMGGILSAVIGALVAQALWDVYKRPSVTVKYSVTFLTANSKQVAGKTQVTTLITDYKTGQLAARSRLSGPDSSLRLSPPRIVVAWTLVVTNEAES